MKRYAFIGIVCMLSATLFLISACQSNIFKQVEPNSPLSQEEAINIALAAIPEKHGTPGIDKAELFRDEILKNEMKQDENGWNLLLRVLLTIDNEEYVNTIELYIGNDGSIKDFRIASDMTELSIYLGIDGK